jgi:hypothetical protein
VELVVVLWREVPQSQRLRQEQPLQPLQVDFPVVLAELVQVEEAKELPQLAELQPQAAREAFA